MLVKKYFFDTYEECRKNFLNVSLNSKNHDFQYETYTKNHNGDELNIDVLKLTSKFKSDDKKVLLLSSGLHGVEGYTGSAIQRYFLEHFLNSPNLTHWDVFIYHGLNPYGFKNNLRENEDNIDLNRSFFDDDDVRPSNPLFKALDETVFLKKTYKSGILSDLDFYIRLCRLIKNHGSATLKRSLLQGQYYLADSLFYGGQKKSWTQEVWDSSMKHINFKDYKKSFFVDLHTGYGEKGKIHLIVPRSDEPWLSKMTSILKENVEAPAGELTYYVTGGLTQYFCKKLPGDNVYPVVVECGTCDNHKFLSSIKCLKSVVEEFQIRQHGSDNSMTFENKKNNYKKIYYLKEESWQKSILEQSHKIFERMMV